MTSGPAVRASGQPEQLASLQLSAAHLQCLPEEKDPARLEERDRTLSAQLSPVTLSSPGSVQALAQGTSIPAPARQRPWPVPQLSAFLPSVPPSEGEAATGTEVEMQWPPSKGCKFSEAGGAPLKGVSGPRRPGKSVGGCHPLAAPEPVPVLGPSACGRGGSGAWNAALRPALPPASAGASGPHLASIRKTAAGGRVGVSRGASLGEKPSGSTSSRDPPRPPEWALPSLRPLPLLPPGPSLWAGTWGLLSLRLFWAWPLATGAWSRRCLGGSLLLTPPALCFGSIDDGLLCPRPLVCTTSFHSPEHPVKSALWSLLSPGLQQLTAEAGSVHLTLEPRGFRAPSLCQGPRGWGEGVAEALKPRPCQGR